jgi:predicted signal transduction protein with EAL and GGDEF domain
MRENALEVRVFHKLDTNERTLAHELGLLVVVEGVENAEELATIKSWGCRLVQGFYFSEPLSVAAMTTLLRIGTFVPDLLAAASPAAA